MNSDQLEFESYDDIEQYKKNRLKTDEDFHRFTGLLQETAPAPVPSKPRSKKSKKQKIDPQLVKGWIDEICENMVCNLGIGHLSDDLTSMGLKFVLPISKHICDQVDSLGKMHRHRVSSEVKKFFDTEENSRLLDDRISSLLPPSATKRFGCEKVEVVFDAILTSSDSDSKGSIYVEIFACPYLLKLNV